MLLETPPIPEIYLLKGQRGSRGIQLGSLPRLSPTFPFTHTLKYTY